MEAKIQNYMWKNIVCRFRIPRMNISNNERQFDNQGFKNFFSGLGIKNKFFVPWSPLIQRIDESVEPNITQDHQISVGGSKGHLARRTT